MKSDSANSPSLAVFGVVWLGQVISQLGSQLTSFVLSVWVLQTTGSTAQYSLIAVCAIVPQSLILLIAGSVADRFDRRKIMILTDTGAGISTLILLFLVASGRVEVWHIYLLVAASSACTAFQIPAFAASVVMLVPEKHLMRANGAIELGTAFAMMSAPMVAGILLDRIGFAGVVAIDLATFLFAVGTLFYVSIPHPQSTEPDAAETRSLLRDSLFGWTYLRSRRGLLALLVLFAMANFTLGMVQIGLMPLVLSFASAAKLGVVLSIATAGMVVGGLWTVVQGGPQNHHMRLIFVLLTIQGSILFLGGLRPSVALVATAAFVFTFCQALTLALSRTIWQTNVAAELQGRVFAIRRLIATLTLPASYLGFGLLAENVVEPWLAPGGVLASSVGRVIGVGPGRGVGFLFIVLGASTLLILALAVGYRPLRELKVRAVSQHAQAEAESFSQETATGS